MNGVLQYEVLDREFEARRVLGGLCQINATLGPDGEVVHLGKFASIVFGERAGLARSARCEALAQALAGGDQQSPERQHPPGRVGKVRIPDHAGGRHLPDARAGGPDRRHRRRRRHPARPAARIAGRGGRVRACVRPEADASVLKILTDTSQPMTASMFRDLSQGLPVGADHIVGDMVRRAATVAWTRPICAAYAHLQVYQAQRAAG